MNRTHSAAVVLILLVSGCQLGDKCADMAFMRADAITRIDVKTNDGSIVPRQVTDPKQIRTIVAFVKARTSDWYAPWYGVPVGQVRTEIYQDKKFIADFAIGKDFFEAQGCGYFYIRNASTAETKQLLTLLGVNYEFK